MTEEERQAIALLCQAWNAYIKLPVQHPMHDTEMAGYIHSAQRLIMSRPTARTEGWEKPLSLNPPEPPA